MKRQKNRIVLTLFTAALLCFSACGDTVEEQASPSQDARPAASQAAQAEETEAQTEKKRGVAIDAAFRQEDGAALAGGTVRVAIGEHSVDYPLDSGGGLRVSGLPRVGEMELTVLDGEGGRALGRVTLSFSEGAVIDASMDQQGGGHVTLRAETEQVALDFTLREDGSLQCALRLT